MARWTKENIPGEFKRLVDEGKTYMDMRKSNSGMISAIQRIYGGVIQLCEEIGVDYNGIVTTQTITKYKADKASKEDIDSEILALFSKGKYVKADDLQSDKDKSWVYCGAIRYYESWNNALKENGIKPMVSDNINDFKDEIIALYNEGKSGRNIAELLGISETAVYGVLKINNVEVDGSRYTRKSVLNRDDTMSFVRGIIKEAAHTKVSSRSIRENNPLEYRSIKHHFNSLATAVVESGEYVLDKGVRKNWSKTYLLDQIKLGYKLRAPLNCDYMTKGFGCSAELYAREAFGSWENAIISAGIDYNEVRTDGSTMATYGHEFESVLSDILRDLNVAFTRYDHQVYRPDFVVGKEWIDAKLSQYTYLSKDKNGLNVIDKYEPYCDTLTLVFLRGQREYDAMITYKTRLVNVYKYVNKLPKSLQGKYIERLNDIERRIDAA